MSNSFFVNMFSEKSRLLKLSLLFTLVLVAFLGFSAYKASAAYGDLITTYCSGYDYYGTYDDGNGGTYDSLIESNSASCGWPPCDPYGTPAGTFCSGYDLHNQNADGACGTYDAGVAEYNSASCGYVPPCDPYGTPEGGEYCSGYDYRGAFADGACGTYDASIENPSATCGYVPCDPYGTPAGTFCSGYDLHNQNADGSCGTYDAGVAEYNSASCGYNPCPGYGELQSTYCSGYDYIGTYADGACGTYDASIENPSTSCGYVPCDPYGTPAGTFCSGYDLHNQNADGACGTYDAGLVEANSASCGWPPCPGYGELQSTYCSTYDYYGTYADGACGTYDSLIEANSVTYCGYIPPCDPYGTPAGTFCSGYDLHNQNADGNCGTYDAGVAEYNSASCGWPPCDPYGTLESTYCSGYDYIGTYADGACGTYDASIENPSESCGWVPCPSYGTPTDTYCDGYDYRQNYADGNCGVAWTSSIENPSASCGWVPCDPYGTLVSTYCSGYDYYGTYADGGCGTYDSLIEGSSASCGCVTEPYGTQVSTYCSGYEYIGVYANGMCGTYDETIENPSGYCGFPAADTPYASPVGGDYDAEQYVYLYSNNYDNIYYTTDGNDPDSYSNWYSGSPITISGTTTLKAIAYGPGGNSGIMTEQYNIVTTAPYADPAGGNYTGAGAQLVYLYNSSMNYWYIYYTTDGTDPNGWSNQYYTPITIGETTTLKAIAYGPLGWSSIMTEEYYFTPAPGTPYASPAGGDYSSDQNVYLGSDNANTIYYTTDGSDPTQGSSYYDGNPIYISGTTTLKAKAWSDGGESDIMTEQYNYATPDTPYASPSGGTYSSEQYVYLYSNDGTIYYTTDESVPDSMSNAYSDYITIGSDTTLKAISIGTYGDSGIMSEQYTFATDIPTADPVGGNYGTAQDVSLSSTDPTATIYYTIDGSTPTTGSSVYATPIHIETPITLKAIADGTYGESGVMTEQYNIIMISGTLTSSIFDTTAHGAGFNSIMWKGSLGAGGTGKVQFQFAASDCLNGATNPPNCNDEGTWSYYGGATCGADDWFASVGPNTPVELKGTTCASAWQNKRYFRYKLMICSNDCVSAGSSTPVVTDVSVGWAP